MSRWEGNFPNFCGPGCSPGLSPFPRGCRLSSAESYPGSKILRLFADGCNCFQHFYLQYLCTCVTAVCVHVSQRYGEGTGGVNGGYSANRSWVLCVCLGVCLGVHCMCMDTSLCPMLEYVRVLYLPNFYDRRNQRLGGKKRKT